MIQVKRIAVVTLCLTGIGCGFNMARSQEIADNKTSITDSSIQIYPEVWSLKE